MYTFTRYAKCYYLAFACVVKDIGHVCIFSKLQCIGRPKKESIQVWPAVPHPKETYHHAHMLGLRQNGSMFANCPTLLRNCFHHASWKLSGSRDGVHYSLLHYPTDVTFAGRGDTKTFRLMYSGTYSRFRFDFMEAFFDNKTKTRVLEIADINLYTGSCNVRHYNIAVAS